MRLLGLVVAVLAVLLSTANARADWPKHDGKVLLFGNLHAHSKLSDDINGADDEMLPQKAFEYADAHGLDFLAITDHHKAADSPHRLWMTPGEYEAKLYDVAMQYNAAHAGGFIAIPGIEWGNTATGNHVNVLGAQTLPPDGILDVDYDDLFAWARDNTAFVQFNHPNSWKGMTNRNKDVGNYGEALYLSDLDFVSAVDPAVATISIISTVKGGHLSGQHKHSTSKTHREMQWENYYQGFLNRGFHLAPAANQDTHWTNWGTVTAARTAAWADEPGSYESLMDAVHANRVYATEDDELAVAYQAEHDGVTYWMGQLVLLDGAEGDVTLLAKIWQGPGSDGDSTSEGPYTVDLIRDTDGIGGNPAAITATITDVPAQSMRQIPVHVAAGEYIYLRVTEQNGKDNAVGDGDDENGDGKRDDLNDSAWTAPIWFVGSSGTGGVGFVWSASSAAHLYHDPECWVVASISEANRQTGTPPAGWTKHDCQS